MTEIIDRLDALSGRYDAVLCDLWGCLHNGREAFPAAVAALQGFRKAGGAVILLTNAPRPNAAVIQQLDRLGVPRDAWDAVVTSGDAAQLAMLRGAVGRRVHHIGAAKDEPFFSAIADDIRAATAGEPPVTRVALKEAEGIVCTGLFDDRTETPEDYRATLLFAKTMALPMLCANPDVVVDMGETRVFCAGAIAEAYAAMGGEVFYYGKPHPPIYDLARQRLEILRPGLDAQVLAIGDGFPTDIRGGMGEGIDTVFVTGGIEAARFGTDPERPDADLLDAWLADQDVAPTFAIGKLR
jgi:HAD superfamily hydrolase (TIGR01459 family)